MSEERTDSSAQSDQGHTADASRADVKTDNNTRLGALTEVRQTAVAFLRDPEIRTAFAAFGGLFLVTELYTTATPLLFDALGLSAGLYGAVRAVANVAELVVSPTLGRLADDRGRFRVAAIAAAIGSVGLIGFTLTPMVVSLVSVGLGGVSWIPASADIIALLPLGVWFPVVAVARLGVNNAITPAVSAALDDDEAGLGWGLRDVVLYAGGAIGLAIGGVITSVAPVQLVFIPAALVLFGICLYLWQRVETGGGQATADSTETTDREAEQVDNTETTNIRTKWVAEMLRGAVMRATAPFRGLPRPRLFIRFAVVDLLVDTGMAAMAFLPLLATEVGLSTAGFFGLYGGSFLVAAPLSVIGGLLSDRYSRKWLYVGNFAAETLALAAFALTGAIVPLTVGLALYTIQTTFEPAVITYFFRQFDDEQRGHVWGVKGTVSKIAGLVGPLVAGIAFDVSFRLPFIVGAILVAVGTVIAVSFPERPLYSARSQTDDAGRAKAYLSR